MNKPLSDTLISRVNRLITRRTALYFPPKRWNDLRQRLGSAAREFGFSDQTAFGEWLLSTPLSGSQLEILASYLTIAETYFWRDKQVFKALEEDILPTLITQRRKGSRHLNLWSAGCASGEEPYSLAMALHRALPIKKGWNIKIVGTDINTQILRKARAGIYGPWSFRNSPPWLQKDYCTPLPGAKFELSPQIRELVSFAYLNLAEDVYPSLMNSTMAMDVIFCRNVLMYFSPEAARRVIQGLHCCLVEGGWLAVSATELSHRTFSQFTPVQIAGTTIYRKQSRAAKAQAPAEPFSAFTLPPTPLASAGEPTKPLSAPKQTAASSPPPKPAEPSSPAQEVRALADQGALDLALKVCEKALAMNKLDPELHYLRASILQEQNQLDDAMASLRHALFLDPNFMIIHFAMGNLMLRQGNRQEAKRSFTNVLGLLDARPQEELLAHGEGLTVGRFKEITLATIQAGGLA